MEVFFQIKSSASETIPIFLVVIFLCRLFLQLHQTLELLVLVWLFSRTMFVLMPERLKGELSIDNADRRREAGGKCCLKFCHC